MVVTSVARAATVLGAAAVVVGAVALVLADGGLATRDATIIGWPQIELTLASFNRLGAVFTIGLGGVAVLGARRRSVPLLGVAAAGYAAMAAQVLIQWGRGANLFGGSGRNLSLWMGLAVGLGVLAWALDAAATDEGRAEL